MKKVILLFTAILLSLATYAQAPNGINYQTVIRDGDGNILPDTEIAMQMTIRSGTPDGEVVYAETHDVITNAFGLVSLVIGNGIPQNGTFAEINWGADAYYLEIAVDMDVGGTYTVLGVTQFLSVPYAIHSQKADAVKDGTSPGEMIYWNGEEWMAIPPGEHDQILRFCDGVPTWGACIFNLDLIAEPTEAGTVNGTGQYEANEQVSITAEANSGWEFINWTYDDIVVSTEPSFEYIMPDEDVTLIANFEEEQIGFSCGDILIDSRDGQSYETVQIGDQCWMAENLNIGESLNGSEDMTDNGTIERYCYDNDPANCETYGGLYQWNEMMQYTTTVGMQGICPLGWHIPTDNEWKILEGTVDSQYPVGDPEWDDIGYRGLDAGGNLKETDTTHWDSPNTSATNSSSFTALPGGYRDPSGSFLDQGYHGRWWSSSKWGAGGAWSRLLYNNSAQVRRINNFNGILGFSVRCLKD